MSNDIKFIQESLINHTEITFPYTFKPNDKIKYITLFDDEDAEHMGDDYDSPN